MSKYLKNFEGHNDYDSYINNNPNLPNVSCCTTPYHVHYNPLPYPHMDVKIKKITDKTIYGLGDTIENRIFIYNDGNKDIINLEVETSDGTLISQKIIDLIPTGCYFVLEAAKTVTEEMILNGYTTTHYTIDGVTYEDETVTAEGDSSSSIDKPSGHLTITKVTTSRPSNGEYYALGESISYLVTVTNSGNLTITNIRVTDEKTENEWTIESLAPGMSREFTPSYIVRTEDVADGQVINIATATGTSPDHDMPDVPVDPGVDPEPCG